ncbi:MAG TPA: hypothetical protein GX725_00880 [Mollicutes bacterium]|jgi:Tfp pilus assembly protein PilE|nr:hypothetical protein [Mollicutes bacterium]
MLKINNKGFFLAETIVVVGIVAAILVLFYSQISVFYRNYERNSKYDTVEAIHAARNVKAFIEENHSLNQVTSSLSPSSPIVDITTYEFNNKDYYNSLISLLNVRKVYLSLYNINEVITNYASYNIDASFLDFLRTQKVKDSKSNIYRVIVILNNGEYARAYYEL